MTPFHKHTSAQKQWRLLMQGTRLYISGGFNYEVQREGKFRGRMPRP
ncbi:hypothetical protein BH11PSE12_BH11PSE12_16530 [soil metagenome]